MSKLVPEWQRASRVTLGRAVRYMMEDLGLRTIIDFGPGLPTCNNTHTLAANVAPTSPPCVKLLAKASFTAAKRGSQ